MTAFFQRLEARVRAVDSLLCVGLDPHAEDLAAPTAEAARAFCLRLIAATRDLAAAYKPNAAFFEALGPEGWAALKEVIAAVPEGAPVILDAKRGDIASTARAYARSAFQELGADAITIHPYLGREAVAPFLEDPARGVFLLCKTSNPGGAELQDVWVRAPDGPQQRLYERVARLAGEWDEHGNLGVVVGATQPEALARVRAQAPDLWILAPGVGAQGADLAAALRTGLRADGLGVLVPVSRGISRAADPAQAAADLVEAIRQGARAAVRAAETRGVSGVPPGSARADLADDLLAAECIRFGAFTLKSGLESPIYIDLRRLISDPGLLERVASAYLPVLRGLAFDRLAALPYAALPIGTAIGLQGGWPVIYPRKEAKDYGTGATIEGVFGAGETAVVVDDVVTTAGSKFEAIEKLEAAGLRVRDVVVLIDRGAGAVEALADAGYRLHAVFTLTDLLDYWAREGKVPSEQIAAVRAFLRAGG